jgi:peptidoglycan/LPS O-acetylase OafA/YrhL
LYLLHIPALTVVDRWGAPALPLRLRGSAALFVSFGLAAAASLSWVAFESQVLRLKNRSTAQDYNRSRE